MKPKLIAYEFILQSLMPRQRQVLTCIIETPNITLDEISKKLRLPYHCISGRLSELEYKGDIKYNGNKNFKNRKPQSKWLLNSNT